MFLLPASTASSLQGGSCRLSLSSHKGAVRLDPVCWTERIMVACSDASEVVEVLTPDVFGACAASHRRQRRRRPASASSAPTSAASATSTSATPAPSATPGCARCQGGASCVAANVIRSGRPCLEDERLQRGCQPLRGSRVAGPCTEPAVATPSCQLVNESAGSAQVPDMISKKRCCRSVNSHGAGAA